MKIAACIITADFDDKTADLCELLQPYADTIYIQVNKTDRTLIDLSDKKNIKVSYFKWTDNFAEARNALHREMLKDGNDYWLWADTGDILEGLENLKGTVQLMQQSQTDMLYCRYEYEQDDLGDVIADQWRERIISTKVTGEWKGAVHETFVPDMPVKHIRDDRIVWKHEAKTEAEKEESRQRNHKILERLVKEDEVDPRDVYYLAMSFFGMKQFDKAVPLFLDYIKASGWPEEQYRAWKKIAEAHSLMGDYDKSISAYTAAMRIEPRWKDAYLGIAECYHWMEQDEFCLHWLGLAEQASVPDTLSVVDPTQYTYRPKMMAAVSAARMGKLEHAYALAKAVQKIQPDYEMVKTYLPIIEDELLDKRAIDDAKRLAKYTKLKGGDALKVFNALPPKLHGHPMVMGEIQQYMPKKTWGDKSIVFVCNASSESWGPDTLSKGMGGSEEAIVYLSRALAKQGWDVTVYNDREEALEDDGVSWQPWTLFNPSDNFNIVVSWRNPLLYLQTSLKAKLKCVDVHDMPAKAYEQAKVIDSVDLFFVKSQYHREQLHNVPDDKIRVIGNGLSKEHFHEVAEETV